LLAAVLAPDQLQLLLAYVVLTRDLIAEDFAIVGKELRELFMVYCETERVDCA
jgi:hypothetical protein